MQNDKRPGAGSGNPGTDRPYTSSPSDPTTDTLFSEDAEGRLFINPSMLLQQRPSKPIVARKGDPWTAHAAARKVRGTDTTPALMAILRVVVAADPRGAICADVVEALGTDRGNTARQITTLLQKGLIERRDVEGRMEARKGPSGHWQALHWPTAAGRALIVTEAA